MRRVGLLIACLCLMAQLGHTPARAQRDRLGAVAGSVTLVPLGNSTLAVSGLHEYLGSVRLQPASDGLVVVNSLPLERYLLGLNEVPTTWPVEALRARRP